MVGTVIADQYRLESVLGMGGTGVVFRATALDDQSSVALKTIRSDLSTERATSRFFRGARLSAGLVHPGIIETLAFGLSKGEEPTPFQVMPLVDGPSLQEAISEALPASQMVDVICQVLDALGYVHARGVLHRDIKPANVLLERTEEGVLRARISDFGIAAAFSDGPTGMEVTLGNVLIGTPDYMAPEQARTGIVNGPALDLYAVGVILYQWIGGRLPFEGRPMDVLADKAMNDAPRLEVAGVAPEITECIHRLLARHPSDRYALAGQVRRELEPFAEPCLVDADWMRMLMTRQQSVHPRTIRRRLNPPAERAFDQHWPTLVLANERAAVRESLPGRESVLRTVMHCASEVERGQCRMVSIVGEAGMGKTTVLERVAADLSEQGRFQVIRAPFFEEGAQRGGVRWGIERYLGLQGLDRRQLLAAIPDFLSRFDDVEPGEATLLVDCLRPRDDLPQALMAAHLSEHMALIVRLLRRLAQAGPVLLLIDDADKASLDLGRFLEFVMCEASFTPWPLLILNAVGTLNGVSGRELLSDAGRLKKARLYKRIWIHPIDREVLIPDLMSQYGLNQFRARQVVERSGGNPMLASYLAQAVADRVPSKHGSTVGGSPSLDALPDDLIALMNLRMVRLLEQVEHPQKLRTILKALAVLGDAVEEDLLKLTLVSGRDAHSDVDLDRLLALEIVSIRDHAEPMVWGLSPVVLREAILAQMDDGELEQLHRRAIEVRLGLPPERRRAHWGLIGDHYAAVGEREDAQRCWLKGMRYEVSAGNLRRGVNWGRQAIAEMSRADPEWSNVAMLAATLMFDAGETVAARGLLQDVFETAQVNHALQAGDLLCDVFENQGETQLWVDTIAAMELRQAEAGSEGLCALFCARSLWRNTSGDHDGALADAQRALELASPGPSSQRAAQRLTFSYLPHMQLDAAYKAACRSLSNAGDAPLLRARSLRTLGTVQIWQGHTARAIETLEEAVVWCRRVGLLTRYPISVRDLADAYRLDGQFRVAKERYEEAIQLCKGLPLGSTVALCRFQLSMCDISTGETKTYIDNADQLIAAGLQNSLGLSVPFGELLRAWALSVSGDVHSALLAIEKVGPLDSISVDPQVPSVLFDISRHLVEAALELPPGQPMLDQIQGVCVATQDVFGTLGDMSQVSKVEVLLERLSEFSA